MIYRLIRENVERVTDTEEKAEKLIREGYNYLPPTETLKTPTETKAKKKAVNKNDD